MQELKQTTPAITRIVLPARTTVCQDLIQRAIPSFSSALAGMVAQYLAVSDEITVYLTRRKLACTRVAAVGGDARDEGRSERKVEPSFQEQQVRASQVFSWKGRLTAGFLPGSSVVGRKRGRIRLILNAEAAWMVECDDHPTYYGRGYSDALRGAFDQNEVTVDPAVQMDPVLSESPAPYDCSFRSILAWFMFFAHESPWRITGQEVLNRVHASLPRDFKNARFQMDGGRSLWLHRDIHPDCRPISWFRGRTRGYPLTQHYFGVHCDMRLSLLLELFALHLVLHLRGIRWCGCCSALLSPRFQTCSCCHCVSYCSEMCQRADWLCHRNVCESFQVMKQDSRFS
jgi:hypothetical protein